MSHALQPVAKRPHEALMFGKSGFLFRALFTAAFVSSLVACTFEEQGSEDQQHTSSASLKQKGNKVDGGDADGGVDDADASVDGGAADGGWGEDGGTHDGGGYDSGTEDGGSWDDGDWDNTADGGGF